MSEAWREVRLRFQANYGGLPALIMAATDGYANSFVNDDAFRKVGSDILAIMREDSVRAVEENLLEWLDEASASGSGDDISLGILYRVDAVRAQSGPAPSSEDAGGLPDVESSTSRVNPAETHLPSEGSRSSDTQLVSGGVRHRATEDSEIGSSFVERFKHEGPREPSKRVRLADAIGCGDEEADDASADVAPRD